MPTKTTEIVLDIWGVKRDAKLHILSGPSSTEGETVGECTVDGTRVVVLGPSADDTRDRLIARVMEHINALYVLSESDKSV